MLAHEVRLLPLRMTDEIGRDKLKRRATTYDHDDELLSNQ